jgi:hypothetical protein
MSHRPLGLCLLKSCGGKSTRPPWVCTQSLAWVVFLYIVVITLGQLQAVKPGKSVSSAELR